MNIIFILVDDLGYEDLQCYGNRNHLTPHIDSLAEQGVRFTEAYTAPTCSPSRASLLTGKAPARLHITDFICSEGSVANPAGQGFPYPERSRLVQPLTPEVSLKPDELTIAEAFKDAGYATGLIGKWHVGKRSPRECGFDEVYECGDNAWPRFDEDNIFMTERKSNEAKRFIHTHALHPFFLYLSFHAIHAPLDASPEKKELFKQTPNPTLAGMISHLDDAVGEVLAALAKERIREQTAIIFMSDNGASSFRPDQILRGHKGFLYEGGVRVPLIVSAPSVTPVQGTISAPFFMADWYPTMLSMAGLPLRPEQHVDGIDQMSVLSGTESRIRQKLSWHYPHWFRPSAEYHNEPCGAMIDGKWKLFHYFEDDHLELYDLDNDISESDNLADEHMQRAQEMFSQLKAWRIETNALIPYRKKGRSAGTGPQVISTKGQRQWQGIPTIERAPNGRLWCAFFSGGSKEPKPENHILLTTSADDGTTWSEAEPIATPDGQTRAYDPCLWHDPDGRLWLFYNEANLETQLFSVCAVTTCNPGEPTPRWSQPSRLDLRVPFAFRLNKPIVLTTGEWVLPVTWSRAVPNDWFAGPLQLQGVAISSDSGATWALHGAVEAPEWALENMIIERRDGTLWMLIRTGSGVLWESISSDRGRTWSEGKPTTIPNPGSRFFVRRLASGSLLLINTPDARQRKGLRACLSERDDGTGFGAGLELDGRGKVSYPDAIQSPDGLVYAVHDCDRYGPGEILLSVFAENDILAEQEHPAATSDSAPSAESETADA